MPLVGCGETIELMLKFPVQIINFGQKILDILINSIDQSIEYSWYVPSLQSYYITIFVFGGGWLFRWTIVSSFLRLYICSMLLPSPLILELELELTLFEYFFLSADSCACFWIISNHPDIVSSARWWLVRFLVLQVCG